MSKWMKTDEYRAWRNIIKTASHFDIAAYYDEVKKIHAARSSRAMRSRNFSVQVCIDVTVDDVGNRSRIVELSYHARQILSDVGTANEAMRSFLLKHHRSELTGSTVAERSSELQHVLRRGVKLETRLETFIETIETVVADIDQTGWAMKRLLEGLELRTRREFVA